MQKKEIRPEDVLKYQTATEDYLCDLKDNKYQIQFVKFKLRDMDTNLVLFENENA